MSQSARDLVNLPELAYRSIIKSIDNLNLIPDNFSLTSNQDQLKHQQLINLAVKIGEAVATTMITSAGGWLIGGSIGGALGCSLVITDEYLINYFDVNKHYLTLNAFWLDLLMASQPIWLSQNSVAQIVMPVITTGAAMLISYYKNDFLDHRKLLNQPYASITVASKVLDQPQFNLERYREIYQLAYQDPLTATKIIGKDLMKLTENKLLLNISQTFLLEFAMRIFDNVMYLFLKNYIVNNAIQSFLSSFSRDELSIKN